jgi:hypothetical protein
MNRSRFLSASGALVAGTATPVLAANVPGGTDLVETRAQFDAAGFDAIVGRPARIRQLFEAVAFKPTIWNNVKNSFNGLQFGYGHAPGEITIAIAGHGPSAAYGYSDYVWRKYRIGEFFKITGADGQTIASNIWLKAKAPYDPRVSPDDERGMYQDTSIEMLQRRGVIIMACHTAAEEQARKLVAGGFAPAGMTPSEVAADILTHLIPGALVNPSMVATVAVLQKAYGYTYAALTF